MRSFEDVIEREIVTECARHVYEADKLRRVSTGIERLYA